MIGEVGLDVSHGSRRHWVDALVSAARALVEAGSEYQRAYEMLDSALQLDPARLELHVDLAYVEVRIGDVDAAHLRMAQLAECYVRRGAAAALEVILGPAEHWEHEFDSSFDRAVHIEDAAGVPRRRVDRDDTTRYATSPMSRSVSEAKWAFLPGPAVGRNRGRDTCTPVPYGFSTRGDRGNTSVLSLSVGPRKAFAH